MGFHPFLRKPLKEDILHPYRNPPLEGPSTYAKGSLELIVWVPGIDPLRPDVLYLSWLELGNLSTAGTRKEIFLLFPIVCRRLLPEASSRL